MTQIQAVIGANYGDEGKGLTTDYLCSRALADGYSCMVILSNGGAQRGHTVETPDGRRFVFHHLGAGSLQQVPSFFSPDYLVNPLMYFQDMENLQTIVGPGNLPDVFMHPDCRFTTPFDMITNQIIEDSRGSNRHGSVGAGIWETVLRYMRGCGISISQMKSLPRNQQIEYMKKVRLHMEQRIFEKTGREIHSFEHWRDIWFCDELIGNYLRDLTEMLYMVPFRRMRDLANYDILVVENAQGILLTQDRETASYFTTPSDTGAKELRRLLDMGLADFTDKVDLFYVTRSYVTRHGAGILENECSPEEICPGMHDITNVPNAYQGTLRYAPIDEEQVLRQIDEDCRDIGTYDSVTHLVVTHLNEFRPNLETFANSGHPLWLCDGRTREDMKRYTDTK